jgi:hypothetical protein
MKTIEDLQKYLKDKSKDESQINLRIYTNQQSTRERNLFYEIDGISIDAIKYSYWDDSYWNVEFDINDLIKACQNYLDNKEGSPLSSELIQIMEDFEFEESGHLDNGFSIEIESSDFDVDDLPEKIKNEDDELDPDLLIEEYDYSDWEGIDTSLNSIDKIFITDDGETFEIEIPS